MTDKLDKLFLRAEAIFDGRSNGLGEPILWHLALRRYGPAMLEIACRATRSGKRSELGRLADPCSPAGLMYRAHRQGISNAAQNMALTLFYVGDLKGYRHWLRKAARTGDLDARNELARFETRQPYPLAKRIGRKRPFNRNGS